MVYLFCSRCRRRREYHWTILLAVVLVFLYTYLYNVSVGSQDSRTEELYGTDRRLPDTREVSDKVQVDDKPRIPDDLVDKPLEVVYKESQLVKHKGVDEIKSKQTLHDDSKSQIPNKSQSVNQIGDKLHNDSKLQLTDKHKVDDEVTSAAKLQDNKVQVDDKLKTTDEMIIDPIIRMREQVNEINEKEVIINDEKFPAFNLVMIIQVHRRTEYLKMLLESLRNAGDISKVLLVVSFDYYDEQLFSIVEKVDFCKVVKIFFPKSIQLYPTDFPGNSPNDCPRDIKQANAKEQKCANADHPDSYGHYREAGVTAIKHHWWWKINHLFDGMKVMAGYNGYVIFLEEDLYVAPDIVPVTKQLISLRDQHCPDCDLIGLGLANKMSESLQVYSDKVDILGWRNNLAYAINRQSWDKIKKCCKEFCTFDDYNWDWTLQSLQASCYHSTMKAVLLKAPRAYHTGTCGTHQRNHGDNCNWNEAVDKIRAHISANKQYYFPAGMSINKNAAPSGYSYKKGFGGWGDPRDHALCLSFVHK